MRCAMFGKLPSKRDFVSFGMEQPFLGLWETWLQTGVAVSREALGAAWQDAFLAAPIWRFWLGSRIAGCTTAGAVMPSVDKVGRYFPLSVTASAPPDARLVPPPHAGLGNWYATTEQFLLAMLEDDPGGELADLVARLAPPPTHAASSRPVPMGSVLVVPDQRLDAVFESLAAEDADRVHGGRSYWWTLGGDADPPQLLVTEGMPDPSFFHLMLTRQQAGQRP